MYLETIRRDLLEIAAASRRRRVLVLAAGLLEAPVSADSLSTVADIVYMVWTAYCNGFDGGNKDLAERLREVLYVIKNDIPGFTYHTDYPD